MLSIKSPDLERLEKNLGTVAGRRDEFLLRNLGALGKRVAYVMRQTIKDNRVTGGLSESVGSEVKGTSVEIGPSAKSGGWDLGLILERGTGPHTPPFEPIRRWAEFRGLPAGAVWMSIRQKGTKAHPFLDETLARGETRAAMEATAHRIGLDMVAYAFQGLGGAPVVGAQLIAEAG